MTDDDGGVLGNLPRSRPGQRSEKRTGRTAAEAAAPRKAAPKKAAPPKQTAPPPTQTAPPPQQPPSHAGDPVGDAIRTVTGVAATGARVAGGVAREVLRRLPRP
jgi:hypothetical protein